MKYSNYKMLSVLLTLILILQLSTSAFATGNVEPLPGTPADQVVEEDTVSRASLFFPELYDGGGILLTLKHTITANGLNTKLLFNTSKTITRANLPSDAKKIYITGLLTHSGFSTGTTNVIRTGLCYQDPDSGYYIPAYYEHVPSATNFTEILCSVSKLDIHTTYYPYIKNLEPDYGSVSGSVGFYYSIV